MNNVIKPLSLFTVDPKTGRGEVARPAFMAVVGVSEPVGPKKEVDVAIAFRGTTFMEEWQSNLVGDGLVRNHAGQF